MMPESGGRVPKEEVGSEKIGIVLFLHIGRGVNTLP